MTELDQKQLGKTLWNIADQLRGAMNADDFRRYPKTIRARGRG
jgi:type I restriction enzyme M protein